jgi:2-polyprenyl-6-hydroxyphenyl methylase/3-demethylubiquinone-9 3-methyltransferase
MALIILLAAAGIALAWDLRKQYGSQPVPRPPVAGIVEAASEYAWYNSDPGSSNEFLLPVMNGYVQGIPSGASVIDLGCGNGSLLATFRERGWQLTGVDFSPSGIEVARKAFPGIRFELGDATEDLARFGYGTYDLVISTETIEHIFLPRKYSQNCFRLLKPGGVLVMSTPFHGYIKNLGSSLLGAWDSHWAPLWDYGHIKFWSPVTLGQLLYESGFENVEWRGAGRFPYAWKAMILRANRPK